MKRAVYFFFGVPTTSVAAVGFFFVGFHSYSTVENAPVGCLRRYDPVFLVETVDGRRVWAKRHYRCTPRKASTRSGAASPPPSPRPTPGLWTFSTLDNGVVSVRAMEPPSPLSLHRLLPRSSRYKTLHALLLP